MILIISEKTDQSTADVIDWLIYYGKRFIVVTQESSVKLIELNVPGNFIVEIDGIKLDSNNIQSVWYRRGLMKLSLDYVDFEEFNGEIVDYLNYFQQMENLTIDQFIHFCLLSKKNVNNQIYNTTNKLIVLKKAQLFGLKIPPSIVTNDKMILKIFLDIYGDVITKAISEGLQFQTEEVILTAYTEKITTDFYERIPDRFSPSFFQKMVPKKSDIRCFFINNTFFPMAIFSQSNERTQIDFRHYDKDTPNRSVPFKLPKMIENKLQRLMKTLHLSSGSIDLIYGQDSEFYFLEVNPVGQFGMTSYPCNYFIEKKIAQSL